MIRKMFNYSVRYFKICIIIHKQECPKSTTNPKSLLAIKANLINLKL